MEDMYRNIEESKREENNVVAEDAFQMNLFNEFFDVPFLPVDKPKFTFIDLLPVLEASVWLCRILAVDVYFPLNGMNKHNEPIC